MRRKPMEDRNLKWSGRMDLNHRPPGPEPGALARLRYAPTDKLRPMRPAQAGLSDYHSFAARATPAKFLAWSRGRTSACAQRHSPPAAETSRCSSVRALFRQKKEIPPEGGCLPAAA